MNNKIKLAIVLGLVGTLAFANVASSALAAEGENQADPQGQFAQGPQEGPQNGQKKCKPPRGEKMREHREEMKQFVENNDYNGWYELMTQDGKNPPILETINEDNFYLLNEMHQAMQNGDKDAAKAIADELGLKKPPKRNRGQFRSGQNKNFGQFNKENVQQDS